jgi:hypothetical protein
MTQTSLLVDDTNTWHTTAGCLQTISRPLTRMGPSATAKAAASRLTPCYLCATRTGLGTRLRRTLPRRTPERQDLDAE